MNSSQLHRLSQKYSVPNSNCAAIIITTTQKGADTVCQIVENFNDEFETAVKFDDYQCALIKFENQGEEYYSINEYATFLAQSLIEELGEDVKVYIGGTVKSLADVSSSYMQALSALNMSKDSNAKGNVHSFKEFVLAKVLEDLPKSKLNEYLEILMDKSARTIFDDQEMISTAEEFLENSLNVSETSRKLYLHRNTLSYRLDKIEKATGLNIRKFSDAVTFRLITVLYKLAR
jgi:carbohydrate diacid regulator